MDSQNLGAAPARLSLSDRSVSLPPCPGGDTSTKLPAICAQALEVTYGAGTRNAMHALGPVDLTVAEGEFLSLVGPSGCGKSTLVKIVAGLLAPTAGKLELNLRGRSNVPIATVFQDYGIFPWKTVRANIEFGLRLKGISRREATERADEWIARLGLGGFESAYPATLSGGMRQRVAVARTLAVDPEILLMDEPFAALDAQLRELLQDELLGLTSNRQQTVVFVTHSLEEAIILGDRVVVMTARPGRILEQTVVPFERPRDSALRETVEFSRIRANLWSHLRSEVEQHLGRQPPGGGSP